MKPETDLITTCKVRGLLHGGRAMCGQVGDAPVHKCWHKGECQYQVKPIKESAMKPDQLAEELREAAKHNQPDTYINTLLRKASAALAKSAPAEVAQGEATVKESLPVRWTGCPDADLALILLGRIDAPDDEARIEQLEQIVMRLGKALIAPPSPDAELVELLLRTSKLLRWAAEYMNSAQGAELSLHAERIDAKLASL